MLQCSQIHFWFCSPIQPKRRCLWRLPHRCLHPESGQLLQSDPAHDVELVLKLLALKSNLQVPPQEEKTSPSLPSLRGLRVQTLVHSYPLETLHCRDPGNPGWLSRNYIFFFENPSAKVHKMSGQCFSDSSVTRAPLPPPFPVPQFGQNITINNLKGNPSSGMTSASAPQSPLDPVDHLTMPSVVCSQPNTPRDPLSKEVIRIIVIFTEIHIFLN